MTPSAMRRMDAIAEKARRIAQRNTVPVERVDLMYPARTDSNGVTWYRPADGYGWTSIPEFAHPSYKNPHALVLQTAIPSEKGKTDE